LVDRCNSGDRDAWEEFYASYSAKVFCAVRKHLATAAEEIEDTVQEVFIHLFKALRKYDSSRSMEAYILEIARRVAISRYRRLSAVKRRGGNPGPGFSNAHDRDCEGPIPVRSLDDDQETALIKAQEARMLGKALNELSEACRKLLGLRYDDGLSYKEIAGALGVKEATLRVQVQRCLSALGRNYWRLSPREAGDT